MPNISAPITRKWSSGSRRIDRKEDAAVVPDACTCLEAFSAKPDGEASPLVFEIVDINPLRTQLPGNAKACLCNGLVGMSRVYRARSSRNRSVAMFRRQSLLF